MKKWKIALAIILLSLTLIGVIYVSTLLLKNSLFQLPQPYQPNITVVKAQYNEGVWRDYTGFTVVFLKNEGEYFRRAEIYDKVTDENYVIVNIRHNYTFPVTLAYKAYNLTIKFDSGVSQTVSWELNEANYGKLANYVQQLENEEFNVSISNFRNPVQQYVEIPDFENFLKWAKQVRTEHEMENIEEQIIFVDLKQEAFWFIGKISMFNYDETTFYWIKKS